MVILNLKVMGLNVGLGKMVEARVLDIDDAAAFETNQVMMLVQLGVETSR